MDVLPRLGEVGLVVLGLAVLLGTGLVVAVARSRARHRALDTELTRSRTDVDTLGRQVAGLSAEVTRLTREAGTSRSAEREYVITSLSTHGSDAPTEARPAPVREPDRSATAVLEDQLVRALSRHGGGSTVRDRGVDLVVRTVALASGVRRALSPEVLDRAAAEAHIARRRSRRERRRELREARRLVREVRAQESAHRSAA